MRFLRLRPQRTVSKVDAPTRPSKGVVPPKGQKPRVVDTVLSFPKSGKTWLSYLYVYYTAYRLLGDEADRFLDRIYPPPNFTSAPETAPAFKELLQSQPQPRVSPALRFAHSVAKNGEVPYFHLDVSFKKRRASTAMFLVRDPRTVVVSFYHHIRSKKQISLACDVDLSEFLRSESFGVRYIITYLNQVVERGPSAFEKFGILHFEDLVERPHAELARMLEHFGACSVDAIAVDAAVRRASHTDLQCADRQQRGRRGRLSERNIFRSRCGPLGSQEDDLHATDVAYLDRVIRSSLTHRLDRYRHAVASDAQ